MVTALPTRRTVGIGFVIVCAVLALATVPMLVSARKVTVPGAPTITAVSSIRKSAQIWDLRIVVAAPTSNGGTRVTSTTVSAGGRTCTARMPATACTLRGFTKGSAVMVTARATNAKGTGKAGTAVRYSVGSPKWSKQTGAPTTTASTTAPTTTTGSLAARPFTVHVPVGYSASNPAPLFVLLHGYSASGAVQNAYMGFTKIADSRGFLLVAPDGTVDAVGNRFWNATDACCDFAGTGVDDEGYLASIIESVKTSYSVDAKRIYFVGHSNGGFMSYRMACRRADLVAGIANLAGATFNDSSRCSPSRPVTILHVHGTKDGTIDYAGGVIPINPSNPYPGALESARKWATTNGCATTGAQLANRLDLVDDGELAGADTTVTSWSGCNADSAVQLWTIVDGRHTPSLSPTFTTQVVDFLLSHPRP